MKLLDFAFIIGKLKTLKRTGWIREKIPDPESIAEHSFRTAVLALVIAPKIGADVNKSVKMALIHDIGEAKIGDVVTRRGKNTIPNVSTKIAKERIALEEIFSLVDTKNYLELFNEFEQNKTKEARLVKQLDKLEMGIQAYEYEKKYGINLEEFFDDVRTAAKDNFIKTLVKELEYLRKKK